MDRPAGTMFATVLPTLGEMITPAPGGEAPDRQHYVHLLELTPFLAVLHGRRGDPEFERTYRTFLEDALEPEVYVYRLEQDREPELAGLEKMYTQKYRLLDPVVGLLLYLFRIREGESLLHYGMPPDQHW